MPAGKAKADLGRESGLFFMEWVRHARGRGRRGQAAVDAGLSILKSGGNAADAAVATILALSVTDANDFCFGGEVPILVYDANRRVVEVVCGQGTAPRLGHPRALRKPGRHSQPGESKRPRSPRHWTPA